MLVEKIIESKQRKIKQWPVNANRASEAGHSCERYLVFSRTRWQEKTLHDVGLQMVFDEGNIHEAAVLRDLQDAGITIIEQQRAFAWPELNLTGHVDGKVLTDNKAIPLEIKSMSPFVYQSIDSVDDLLDGKYEYLRKYPAQLTLYMLMDNKDEALFLFKNKVNGQLKEIPMKLDYEYGETLVQKIERVNRHVAAGTTPDPIEWDERTCSNCGFAHICLPEAVRGGLEMVEDPELENKIKRCEELKPLVSEHDAADKEVKTALKGVAKKIIGDYLVIGKEYQRQGKPCWKTTISKIDQIKRRIA